MSLRARLNHVEKLAGADAAEDRRPSIDDLLSLQTWLALQGFLNDARAAVAAGLKNPPQFQRVTLEMMAEAEAHVEAYRARRMREEEERGKPRGMTWKSR
jgi:hypothetical protein